MQPKAHLRLKLPAPQLRGQQSLESVLATRRSVRHYTEEPLSLQEVSQLMWAAQGITSADGERTAPSAGALYPLELCVVAGRVRALAPGVYRYQPGSQELLRLVEGDKRAALARAALRQECVQDAAVILVLSGVYPRSKVKYGERGSRYVHIEVGHAAQNVLLQATALGLGAVPVGAFEDATVRKTLGLPSDERVLYLVPVGRPR